ncbi:hypothetical protein Q8F55_003565 [Vanrija albida]|uniref:DH domain-containing protein n=1 Tax=Vanrija albida TaxID=181172 RepID=A0ABR3Q4A5_9TREE
MAQFPPLSVITSTIDEADSAPATATAPALSAKHLATPTSSSLGLPSRSRTASVSQYSVDEDGGESSDEDSVLSYWSSDDESDHEEIVDRKAKQAAEVEKAKKEEEKKRREQERQKALAAAGLKIRSEAPGIPVDAQRKAAATRRRRPAPAVPQRDKKPSASPSAADKDLPQMTLATTPDIQVQDAYARYEQFLSDATAKPSAAPTPRPTSIVVSSRPTSMVEASSPAPSTASRSSAFSGFLGRLGVGHTAAQERTTPKISGPIVSGPILGGPIGAPLTPSSLASSLTPASEAPEPASDFGKTWGSLVDPSVLSTMTTQERKRQESIFEFIATESSYVRDLQLIVGVFYAKLMTILDDKSLTVIFANVEDILMFNSGFLSSLDDRQKACRLYVDTIGDILADNLINLDVYRPYCVNQDTAAKLLQQLRKQDARLEATLMDIKVNNPSVRGLDLSSFLLQPMQRLTRYPLLLKQIAHYTQPDQDLEAVQRALASTERTVARINEDVREAESLDRLRVLSEDLWVGGEGRIDLTEPTAFQGPRKLIKEGSVAKAKSGRKLTMVLCTDVVILIEAGHLYRMPIPLFDVDVRNGRDDVSFALGVGSDVIRLKAPSNKERIEWIAMLSKARRDAVDARRDAGGAVPASSVRSRSDSVQPRDSREQRRQSNYGGYDEQRRQSNYGGYDEQRRPTSGYGFDDAPAPRLSYDAPAQPAPPRRPVSGYEYRAELDKHTPAPPPRPDYVQSYPGQRVYDDAHTYAGRGENMYNHEF